MIRKINFKTGFSLIEMMVVLAVGSIVMVGMSQMFTQSSSLIKNMQAQTDAVSLQSTISSVITNHTVCTNNLQTALNAMPFTPPIPATQTDGSAPIVLSLADGATPTVLKVGADIPKYGLKISSDPNAFRVVIPYQNPGNTVGPITTYSGRLEMMPEKRTNSAGGAAMHARTIGTFTVDVQAGQIVGCVGAAVDLQKTCTSFGGVWDDVLQTCAIPTPSSATTCAALGGTWNGTNCLQTAANCTALGGTWNAVPQTCSLPIPTTASTCTALGGTWNGTSCSMGPSGSCTPGNVMVGTNPSTDCVSVSSLVGSLCSPGQYVVANGSSTTCATPAQIVAQLCPNNGEFAVSNGTGGFSCQSVGTFAVSPAPGPLPTPPPPPPGPWPCWCDQYWDPSGGDCVHAYDGGGVLMVDASLYFNDPSWYSADQEYMCGSELTAANTTITNGCFSGFYKCHSYSWTADVNGN